MAWGLAASSMNPGGGLKVLMGGGGGAESRPSRFPPPGEPLGLSPLPFLPPLSLPPAGGFAGHQPLLWVCMHAAGCC